MSSEKEIRMGKLPKEWNQTAKSVTFCVTEDCNLACKYCYMTGKNKKNKMSFDVARKAVDYILSHRDQFKEEAVIWEFVGGEPFLEIDLIDRICDYIKQQMFLLGHPWFDSYRFNFSTNGILYSTPAVQKYIWKNRGHVSIGISIDGNKIKHDLQRVRPDGSGSFDDVVRNVPLWLEQFPGASTKSTFSHEDLPHLKESIIALWDLGIDMVAANVVFEDVWHEGDDQVFEEQLRSLADYIIDNRLYYDYSVRFFDPQVGNPLTEDNLNSNYCGSGKMLAIDCSGNFYPCIRFYDISLTNRKGYKVGDIYAGINEDRLRPFQSLTLKNQSTEECINCEVGRGCAWCSGCNYNLAETDTIYQRATYICKMHKANVRANEYFWNKFSLTTGLPSEKEKLKRGFFDQVEGGRDLKFMQIMMADDVAPACSYRNEKGLSSKMSKETLEKSLEFCKKNGFIPVFLGGLVGPKYGGDAPEGSFSILSARCQDLPMNSIAVHDNCA
ncbi:MAG TPA: radical SAM peptide maturase, CXXX-repeat target family, partial [Methanotrichaceae archaeon]|nr:radical SAM peptide maturase, CXXX-repeat target family [Methanotrichaceae archaeon]